ncbi:MAG: amino acid ABC transporter permease [Actinomycetota bacterium]|nr:amino acid ABC transporter permease [Actinomycetota bacterium]MDQ3639918.1 amino acid ABC transporter permease [Actinomycetota bacterium]
MTAPMLADVLGPRGRRRVALASVVAGLGIAAVMAVAVQRLVDTGQLDADRWQPLTQGPVIRFFLNGLLGTLRAALVAMVLAMAVGMVLALGRLARAAPIRLVAGAYVELFRAFPLLLLVLFSGLALPKYGVDLPVYWYVVLALVVYNSAVLGEIFRAGILSLDRGQTEAAYTLGFSYWQAMLIVVIPQAVRRMVPAIVSQLVTLLKDTSLGFVIAYPELLRQSRNTGEFFQNPLQSLFVAALLYIGVNLVLSRVARRLEIRQRRRYGAGAIAVAGIEDLTVVTAQAEAESKDTA